MKRKKITLEESKQIQLDMLKEIDTFCRANNIRYSLAFGTLLGAVRHKGFIPWDDDVDIMMPLPDMLKFKELFKSDNLKYCDVDTEKHFEYIFSRIADTRTYNKTGMIARSYGICIDVYPIVSIPDDENEWESFVEKTKPERELRKKYRRWQKRLLRWLPIHSIPGFDKVIRRYRDIMLYAVPYGTSKKFWVVAGPILLRSKMTYDFDLFEQLIELPFEEGKFYCISKYKDFLTMRYGDYMQLPPENDRHPYHGYHYFWK